MSSAGQHVVFMNVAATGHMQPSLPLVAELTARGCRVTYFVEHTMREVVEAAGATWRPFRYPESDFTGTLFTLSESGLAKYVPEGTPKEEYLSLPMCQVYNAEAVLPALIEDLRALEERPAVIVYDAFIAFAQVAAHVLGIKAVCLLTMPGPGVIDKPAKIYEAWESKPWVEGPRQEILAKYGFDVLKHGMPMEFYSPALNLVTTVDELFVPPNIGHQQQRFGHFPFRCVGVLANSKVKRISNANVKQDSVEELSIGILDEALAEGRQVLYISMGTVATSARYWIQPFGEFGKDNGLEHCTGKQLIQHVLRTCFEAVGGDHRILVIVSLGSQADVLDGLPTAPSNFVLRQTVPQLEVLKRCSAFVTHGGANSMHEALSLGVPMAVVPIFGDQPKNADSVAAIGAGLSFRNPLESLTASSLREALRQLMEPGEANSFHASALAMSKKLAAAGGVATAVEAILDQALVTRASEGGA